MGEMLQLEVATPSGMALEVECSAIAAPSVDGEFGVLPNHLPLLASLKCGVLTYEVDGVSKRAAVGPGFVQVASNRVEILTERFVLDGDVDAVQAKLELEEAEAVLKDPGDRPTAAIEEARVDLEWATAQLGLA